MIRLATIVAVGGLRGWSQEGFEEYLKRLRGYLRVEVVEVRAEDINRRSPQEVLADEGKWLLRRLPQGAHVVALDRERGRGLSSEEFSRHLSSLALRGHSHAAFVVGGALGLSEEVMGRADDSISFGGITLPHALARVMLAEQLYRAVKIERGEKYHW